MGFYHLSILVFSIISSYIQIYLGVSASLTIVALASTFIIVRNMTCTENKDLYFSNIKLFLFPLVITLFFFSVSVFPPIYDDEFSYVATLPKLYNELGRIQYISSFGIWTTLYQSYESVLTAFRSIGENRIPLRGFNLLILLGIFLIFECRLNQKLNFYNKIFLRSLILSIPVLALNGLILKNDIFAGYCILLAVNYLFYEKQDSKNENIGFIALAVLATLKPIFFTDGLVIALLYFFTKKNQVFEVNKKTYLKFFCLIAIAFAPWALKNLLELNQPFFPLLKIPFLSFSLSEFNVNYGIFKAMFEESIFGLKNFSYSSGDSLWFIKNIFNRFGSIYLAILLYGIYKYKNVRAYLNIILLVSIYCISLWELRYHIGVVLAAHLFLFEYYEDISKNLYRYIKTFKKPLSYIPLVFLIFFLFSHYKNAFAIYKHFYISPSLYFYKSGYDEFVQKYMSMRQNNDLIIFLNANAKNSNIYIDNSIFYYLDKSINYYWLSTLNISLIPRDYIQFKNLLIERRIKYIVYDMNSLKGYVDFGWEKNKIPNIVNFFQQYHDFITMLEAEKKVKFITKFSDPEAIHETSIYEVMY
jgi:hypothetical protein